MAGSEAIEPGRRDLLRAAGGFTLAFALFGRAGPALAVISPKPQPGDAAAAAADHHPLFAPNAFIRIDAGFPVRLVMPNVEMGQGIYGTEAALLAEELDLDMDQVVLEHSPPNEPLYATPMLAQQATGGSTSTRSNWLLLRQAGAVARTMLVGAAAQQWGVDPAGCTVTRGVVTHAASGRSASYPELATAAARQPVPDKPKIKDAKDFKLLGRSLRRPDTAAKVDGSMRFGIDADVPGMKIAVALPCPVAGGRVRSVDDRAARAVPGVVDIVRDEGFVAVIGEHFWAAKKGAEALVVEWDHGEGAGFSTESLFAEMEHLSKNGRTIVARSVGDINQAGTRIEAVYQLPMLSHAPMEPLNATVHVRPDACEVWIGTQAPTRVVDAAVRITGLSADKVIVHNHYVGGGFGRRLEADWADQAIRVAKAVPYPVKLIWTREQDIRHDIPRPAYYDRIAAVVDGDGYPVAWTDVVTGASVAARWAPQFLRADGFDSDLTEGADQPPYKLPNLTVEWAPLKLPPYRPVGWWRGVGMTHNLFKVESFIDELAHAAGKDPVAYRRHLLQDNKRVLAVLDLAAEKMGWGAPLGHRVGRGVALGSPFGSHICAMVEVEVSPQGEIHIRRAVVAADVGQMMNPNTVEAQAQGGMVFGFTGALYSELTFAEGAAQQGNFNDYRMARINETPDIEVYLVKNEEDPGGIGETGTTVAAPALANAIFAATGVRVRKLPIDRSLLVESKSATKVVVAGIAAGVAVPLAATLLGGGGGGAPEAGHGDGEGA